MHARDINCFIHADIAVGAPFDDWKVKVFIYHGSIWHLNHQYYGTAGNIGAQTLNTACMINIWAIIIITIKLVNRKLIQYFAKKL